MMRRVSSAALFFTLLAALGPADAKNAPDPRAWPQNYEPVSITAQELLSSAKRARGTETQTLRITYDVHDGGLTGSERDVWLGDDYRSDTTLGPFTTADGRYHGARWELGENGYTLIKRGIHQRTEANERALDSGSDEHVRVLGRLRAPVDAYVLRVAPPNGREERRFYDAATFHLIRVERSYPKTLSVATYDDYRTVNGSTIAYRATQSDGHPQNDSSWTIREFAPGAPVTPAEVAIAHGHRAPVAFPPGVDSVRLPARIDDDGVIVVRLTVNGRGLDFQLDSGCSTIVLDRGVAGSLGLPMYGGRSMTVAGTFTSSKTIVKHLEIGTIAMDDVAVEALPFSYDNDQKTKVVGLLGFDFIAGAMIKVDYQNGTVDAIRYGVEPAAGVAWQGAVLDDGVPMIPLTVNGTLSDRFILDTGASHVVLFGDFAKKHAAILKDNSPGRFISYAFNTVTSGGVGGTLKAHALALERMQISRVVFANFFTMVMSGDQPGFEAEDYDGLIGASVLSAFDLYLDYAHGRVGFALNDSGKKGKPARGPGSDRDNNR